MRIDKVHIKSTFKNLDNFEIDFDETSMETVLIGLNATGKSNFFEALVIIFRDLDLERDPEPAFTYFIKYKCKTYDIEVSFSTTTGYSFIVDNVKLRSKNEFFKSKDDYLPRHVFIYYSGTSDRLKNLYSEHEKRYYSEIIKADAKYEKFDRIRRIFLSQNIHASFALIAFYMFKERESETIQFLKDELKIHDFGSALFVLKQPAWSKVKKETDQFWNAKGLVRRFIEDLWLFSLAPIYHEERISTNYKKAEKLNLLYLFLSDKESFQSLVDLKYSDKIQLFNALESIHISDLLHDVKIKVWKENVDGELAMGELSEGEKQLLTVLGLLKFTKDEESLILLDEPDTHLNPMWKWKYLDYIDQVVKRPETTQIIFCTHDPLVIGSLRKEQVRIFATDSEGKTIVEESEVDPRGLGVAGILTSEIFKLPTTLDLPTQELLNQRNELVSKQFVSELSSEEQLKLQEIFQILNHDKGINMTYRDPLYQKFIQIVGGMEQFKIDYDTTPEQLKQQNEIALKILDKIYKESKQ
ncbi:AAA family ATPase [Flavobacterium sp. ENC]|uniref:AAA family ATPase n=1 Tax=Flavobacterium sp. ENC TaxID=2897330 RepID=UPI001E5358E5|nr:ATP-binding protein [Flavobacterium sp. ENC]MCD0464066.1 AAA family ATPase [Flavobacterium sp. ENC]